MINGFHAVAVWKYLVYLLIRDRLKEEDEEEDSVRLKDNQGEDDEEEPTEKSPLTANDTEHQVGTLSLSHMFILSVGYPPLDTLLQLMKLAAKDLAILSQWLLLPIVLDMI